MKRFVIGIDPGMHTGVALYDRMFNKILSVSNHDFWSCVEMFRNKVSSETTEVIIEAPVKTAMYARQEENVKNVRYGNRMMANAASNAHEAELLADGLERLGFSVRRVRPKRRNFDTAVEDIAYIEETTGFTERTNVHTRDAIMLCWGK